MRNLIALAIGAALCGCPERSAERIDVRMAEAAPAAPVQGRAQGRRARPPSVVEQVERMDQVAQRLSRPVGAAESVLFNLHRRLHADLDVGPAARRGAKPLRAAK